MTSPGYPTTTDASEQREPPVKPGEELAGKYRVERVVGAGAMGVVVEARHIELDQQVAIKFLYPEFARNADGAERFRREARAAVKIRNEHVARVIDVGTVASKNIPFIVMEYLHGRDLARELAERGTLPVQEAVRYILEACEAVADAHKQGIVHRDLKPANMFLAQDANGQRSIKVLDFGISKVNGQGSKQFSLTDTATLMGSPAYMSPEQLESSRNVDGRSDIWSLGVILHELILGSVPFSGESVPQLVRAILAGKRTTLLERDPALEQLEKVVARCLRQDRAERYQDIAELCAALKPLADGSPATTSFASARASMVASEHGNTARGVGGSGSDPSFQQASRAAVSRDGVPAQSATSDEAHLPPESAWGNTQQGRRRLRGAPIAAVVAALGLVGYWVLKPELELPAGTPHMGATVTPLLVEEPPAAAAPDKSRDEEPGPPPTAAAAPTMPRAEPPAPETAPKPKAEAAAPALIQQSNGSAPQVRLVVPASPPGLGAAPSSPPAAATVKPKAPAPSGPSSMSSPRAASSPQPTSDPATDKPAADGEGADKTKSDPPRRDTFEIPDFGGRE